ncbi:MULTISPECIES: gamma carbonic anhydrase family protein [Halomonas]|uniref:gamma carbonic anhydrase family protein n=1 Tax=Halomonas TaxID=2745 RepID=UPI001A8ED376|nr:MULTISPECIES: gamma carbonic anhydrase family protein [Halomonas]MBN8414409.1 gamma carbonic anhydrase family protein [Halomonas litopenaei]MBY5927383.1 gamma carbonic anhydrase family protein [Halomonas sp. DP4Y7-2]MBY5984349.1 gamma carbonic anhydrase family protein [Halomonas sp. DP5Y7-2]MBY6206849.1 gamma carbonic anhydrase family protein [Halomonas sp. DP3Y7-2]MBY6230543.1 gamma carbonic anhydrase family protein [Halomonas sp. DP3Y7-1]
MTLYRLGGASPDIAADAMVMDEATLIGDVQLGADVSVWPGAVLRGDNAPILVGAGSNLQDGCVVHTDPGEPVTIGQRVTIGHLAMLHGCRIGDEVLVGMNATILNAAVIGEQSIVGAGALITSGKRFPPRSLILGSPAKRVRELTEEEVESVKTNAQVYIDKIATYASLERIEPA